MTNKYTLKMADGTEVENIQKLREHFDLLSIMEHFYSGKLLKWLNALYYEEKSEMLESIDPSMDDYEEIICQILRVPYSHEEAIQCFEKGAANGNAEAQFHLGCFYMFGDGVELDEKRGLELIHKAAEQGHLAAQYEMGVDYTEGNGTEIDEKEALKWFRRAAESGYAEAQYWLGVNYSYGGSGLAQNNGESGEWLKKAADQGHIDALHWLGKYYREVHNDEEAAKCWQLAAEEGHPGAQYMLACCYADGFGVDKDEEKAKKWLQESAEQGYQDAVDALEAFY